MFGKGFHGAQGVGRLYAIKHRQAHVPLAICVADVAAVEHYGMCAHLPQGLLGDLLPGPVTVLLARRPDAALSAALNPSVQTIGEPSGDPLANLPLWALSRMLSLARTSIEGPESHPQIHYHVWGRGRHALLRMYRGFIYE